jgi:F-type H+-transporting ATPase subunit b
MISAEALRPRRLCGEKKDKESTMPDWAYTLIAQIINIAILVFLLRRFLYKPVRKILSKRREKVRKDMEDASLAKEEAESSRSAYEERLKKAESEAEALQAEAREKARKEIEASGAVARQAAEEERSRIMDALERERREAETAMRERELDVALDLSKRILQGTAGPALSASFVAELAERVRGLSPEELPALPATAGEGASPPPVLLRISHDPGPETIEAVRDAFRERLGSPVDVKVETARELLCGAEAEFESLVVKNHLAQRLEEARESLEKTMAR